MHYMYLYKNGCFNSNSKRFIKNKIKKRLVISIKIPYDVFYILLILWTMIIHQSNTLRPIKNHDSRHELLPLVEVSNQSLYDDHIVLPPWFDARDRWPHCTSIGDIKNQGSCKSGWAVAIASVITDRMCIQHGKQDDLSAYNLLSCCENCCGCRGGAIIKAWEYVKEEGLLSGGSYGSRKGCQPYMIRPCNGKTKSFDECGWKSEEVPDCLPSRCTNKIYLKSNHFGRKHRIESYILLPRINHDLIMKELYFNGPVQVSMHLYDDFRYHTTGVYIRSSGNFEGDHAVKLIGWDENRNWLLINSFGERWGDNGTFLIPRDHEKSNCDFGYAVIIPKLNGTNATQFISKAILLRIDYILYIMCSALNIFLKYKFH